VLPPKPPEPVHYEFSMLKSDKAKSVVEVLLKSVSRHREAGESLARAFSKALKDFARQAHEILSAVSNGRPVIPDEDRQMNGGCTLVLEAERATKAMVEGGALRVAQDFILCIEAFGISRRRPAAEQDWLCRCIKCIIEAGLKAAPEAERQKWKDVSAARVRHEAAELYSSVDVRAWPHVLELTGADHLAIDPEAFKTQLRLQLCTADNQKEWLDGLRQAADLIKDLRQARTFTAREIREIFNDHHTFEWAARKALLVTVLRSAPRLLVQEVLRQIDGDDVDISERDDEELYLVRELIKALQEDIRNCKHAFFKMKSEWLSARWSGVVFHEELSPDQVCDHIEKEDNYEEHLKVAVNRCLRTNRKFEAARMLARPASRHTKVYDSNRNDKQLSYLISLYQDLEPAQDHFGPVEEQALALPFPQQEVLVVADAGEDLAELERLFLEGEAPVAVGIWWFWRCFDPKLDFWPRASCIAIASKDKAVIVDFLKLEAKGEMSERRGKEAVCRILQAPYILKVVHDLDNRSLQVLQRGLLPHEDLVADESSGWPCVTPVVDLAVVAAFVRRTRPSAPSASKLSGLTFDYLRLELCLAEALGNFEQRPMRASQMHYALTLAWCPLMILRVLCSYRVVEQSQVMAMALRVGMPGSPDQWDETLRRMHFAKEVASPNDNSEDVMAWMNSIPGDYAANVWDNAEWREKLPKPDPTFPLQRTLRENLILAQLQLPRDAVQAAESGLASAVDEGAISQDLFGIYQAYHAHLRLRQGAA